MGWLPDLHIENDWCVMYLDLCSATRVRDNFLIGHYRYQNTLQVEIHQYLGSQKGPKWFLVTLNMNVYVLYIHICFHVFI